MINYRKFYKSSSIKEPKLPEYLVYALAHRNETRANSTKYFNKHTSFESRK